MKVLIVSPNSPNLSIGGVERCVKNTIKYCSALDNQSFCILPAIDGDRDEQIGNLEIFHRQFLTVTNADKPGVKAKAFYKFVRKVIWEKRIDVVLAENFHIGMPPAFCLMLNMACISQKVPLVIRLHSFATKPIQEELVNSLFWKRIICVSKSVAGDSYSKGADVNKLATKYLGVDLTEFNPQGDRSWLKNNLGITEDEKVIVCASRILKGKNMILKEKGLISLIEAYSKILPKLPKTKLVFCVGKPPSLLLSEFDLALEKLKGYIKLNGLEDKVYCEFFSLDQMPDVYRGSDLFVLASENETFGQVYIEAMACGTPVIGTNVGGIPEIITNSENGFLVPIGDASALADKIEQLLTNDELRMRFIEKGSQTVQNKFSMDELNDELFNHFLTKSMALGMSRPGPNL